MKFVVGPSLVFSHKTEEFIILNAAKIEDMPRNTLGTILYLINFLWKGQDMVLVYGGGGGGETHNIPMGGRQNYYSRSSS